MPSPTITALQAAVAARGTQVVDPFWLSIARDGSPIVELVPGDTTRVIATFVYRDSAVDEVVSLSGGIAGWTPETQRLERVAQTDVHFRTIIVPSNTRIGYWFTLHRTVSGSPGSESKPDLRLDPFNHRVDSIQGPRSVFVGPKAVTSPWTTARPAVRAGRLDTTVIWSEALKQSRRVWVYTPAAYDSNAARRAGGLPFIVLFDGGVYHSVRGVPTPTILDNLIADHRIPPVIALLVDNQPIPAVRQAELAPNSQFAEFVAQELVPWGRAHYALSTKASDAAVGGSSLGGIAGAFVALRYPETFGSVISQSGSYWWTPDQNDEGEWLTRAIVVNPRERLRFYIEVGRFEPDGGAVTSGQVASNRRLRDVLRARGYDVIYQEFPGGHEYLGWRETLPGALIEMFGRHTPGPSDLEKR